MSPEQSQSSLQKFLADRGLAVLIGLAVLGLVLICVFGFLLLRSLNQNNAVSEDGTPTPFPDAPVTTPVSEAALIVGVSESSTVTMTVDAPVSLRVGDHTFTVQTQSIAADGAWSPTGAGEGTAVWVYGTVINYVVGLADSTSNKALLEQLAPGNELTLVSRSGKNYTFSFDSRDVVPATNRDVFAQSKPGLTVVLLQGAGDERLVVHGTYVVPETTNSGSGNVVELGETAQLEEIQVTVTGAVYMPDRPEAPPGFAFLLVDYEIQNTSLTAFDTGILEFSLLDELGNQYRISPTASQLGNYPPLGGFLNANQVAQATIGFQIPTGLTSSSLTWLVNQSNTGNQIMMTIPFPGGSQTREATISLQSVEVSADLTSLILQGQVTSSGEQPVIVSEADVSLKTNDGSTYLLLATNPAFPWSVPAGQSAPFTVTYQRPLTADTAIFTVLSQPFQLSDLR